MTRYCRMCDEVHGEYVELYSHWEILKHIWNVHRFFFVYRKREGS